MDIKQVPAHPSNYTASSYPNKIGFVLHWSVTYDIEGIDAVFQKPNSGASAHYGVGENKNGLIEWHQYVQDQYYAWANGSNDSNRKHISIEHVGGTLQNGIRKKPTQATHDASVELIVALCKKYGIKKLERKVNIFKHNEVSNKVTECCGSLDIDYITNKVNNILADNVMDDTLTPPLSPDHPSVQDAISWNQKLSSPVLKDCSDENLNKLGNLATILVMFHNYSKNTVGGVKEMVQSKEFAMYFPQQVVDYIVNTTLKKVQNPALDITKITEEVKKEIIKDLND